MQLLVCTLLRQLYSCCCKNGKHVCSSNTTFLQRSNLFLFLQFGIFAAALKDQTRGSDATRRLAICKICYRRVAARKRGCRCQVYFVAAKLASVFAGLQKVKICCYKVHVSCYKHRPAAEKKLPFVATKALQAQL